MIRILDVGANKFDRPGELFPSEERTVVRLDANPEVQPDILHDIRQPLPPELHGAFDVVVASHVLEHISWREVTQALRNIGEAVSDGGSLWVLVPDLEWCAKRVLSKEMDLGFMGALFGGQLDGFDSHLCGFTRDTLRIALENRGWRVSKMYRTSVLLRLNGREFEAQQIICEARR